MFYYLYEIKNLVNGKTYIGAHSTSNLDDGYFGSGKLLQFAIQKHGVESFNKTILEFFDDPTSMFDREREVVNEEFVARDDTYNMKIGGNGGFDSINKSTTSTERRKYGSLGGMAFASKLKQLSETDPVEYQHYCESKFAIMHSGLKAKRAKDVEFNQLVIDNAKKAAKKTKGTMWVNDGIRSFRVPKSGDIPHGCVKGRLKGIGEIESRVESNPA